MFFSFDFHDLMFISQKFAEIQNVESTLFNLIIKKKKKEVKTEVMKIM